MRTSRVVVLVVAIAVLASAAAAPAAQAAGSARYIVVLKDSTKSPKVVSVKHSKQHGAKVKNVYRKALKGYAAKLDNSEITSLRKDPNVKFVVRDGIARIVGKGGKRKPPKEPKNPPQNPPADPPSGTACYSWGLDCIDQLSLPLSGTCDFSPAGTGVTAWVLDTGIRFNHEEFEGRASSGIDVIDDDDDASDCHGHGTHVAATIGGKTCGVARNVLIKGVRVLDCGGYGTWSGVIRGIDYVVANKTGKDVANMSLGGGANAAVDAAVQGAINAGVTFAIAAGNSGRDACRYSPARVGAAITVGATTSSDNRASYSNYGKCLDLFAPGSSIKSAWWTTATALKTISGTSMATPHVAGWS